MAKLIGLVVFILAFVTTWYAFNSRSDLGIDTHAGIQSKLSILIEDTIKEKRPQSSNFKLLRMYTERVDDQKVSAHFSYEFDDVLKDTENENSSEKITQRVAGVATLSRSPAEDPTVQKWVLQSVKTGTESFDFAEGTTIVTDGKTDSTNE